MSDRSVDPNESSEALEALEARGEARTSADQDESGGRRRKARSLVVGLATMNLLLIAIIVAKTAGSQTTIAEAVGAPADLATEVAQAAEATATSQATAATNSGRSVPAVRAPRTSGEWFVPNGDISDIMCRPQEGEAEEAWRARVPSYCQT